MSDKILAQMKRGIYYPGHHLGSREQLDRLLESGELERMDASFLCGPDSEPAYCLNERGASEQPKGTNLKKPRHEISRQP